MRDLRAVLVSSYPPRHCGVAATSGALSHILTRQAGFQVRVIAIEPKDESFDYGPIVVGRIQQGRDDEYLGAIDHIDRINPDVICLQHEYGLWGRWDEELISDHAVRFLETVRKNWPGMGVVSTLHTVRPSPSPLEYDVIRGIVGLSSVSTVMADTGVKILRDGYGITSDTIVHLPLGVSAGDDRSRASCKRQLDLQGRTVISTLGLLDPRKGVEYAIRAMRTVVARYPDALYIVAGETHPEHRKYLGEQYRAGLYALVRDLRLCDHVRFIDRYLSDREIIAYVQASDIYVTPYLAHNQITSGMLALAVANGKAIISTPYEHAVEALGDGCGLLVAFRDADALAQGLIRMLDDPSYRTRCERHAAARGAGTAWPQIGARYAAILCQVASGEPFATATSRTEMVL